MKQKNINKITSNNKQIEVGNGIEIKGARVHNLKNIDVTIPRNALVVVTGVSGSGKSSLTIDTLFAEGQRRYAESLSAYARQFLNRMDKPDVDYIKGLCPAIAIEQKVITRTPRSTVGSMTEIYDYLRLLYARVGKTISPVSGRDVRKDDVTDVVKSITHFPEGTKVYVLIRFAPQGKRNITEELNILIQKGFSRLYEVQSKGLARIEELIELNNWQPSPDCYILIDRLVVKSFDEDDIHRISDSVQTGFYEGEGDVYILADESELIHFSNRFELDGIKFEEPVPNLFSFNNPFGACPVCEGFAQILGIDPELVIPDKSLSVYEGAVIPWKGEKLGLWKEQFIRGASKTGFPVHRSIRDLTTAQYAELWEGNQYAQGINDFFKEVEQQLYKIHYRVMLSRFRGKTVCTSCKGYRLRKEALYIKVNSKHIGELCTMSIDQLKIWFETMVWTTYEQEVAKRILIEIKQRLKTLTDVGLGYLSLHRLANSLSGGESQRIQLTKNLGSNLTNSLYILDEPSIGLHSRDTQRLIGVLKNLRDLNNTVVVVEHDEMMMREADYIIDMGPLASHLGGEVIAEGNYNQIINNDNSLTGKYLNHTLTIDPPEKPKTWNTNIVVFGACQNNLKNIDVVFPLNILCAVSGVSGSGKTTLVKQILYPALAKKLGLFADKVGAHRAVGGDIDLITHVEMVDQNPIGKSSRSNPVTYIKAYDEIRELYSDQRLSTINGFMPGHFSFNVDGGRCDTCKGEGEQLVEMQFLADVHLVCESCKGKRFKDEILEVHYREKSIYDILQLSVDDALLFFKDIKEIKNKIQPLQDVGLGYVKLGQSSNTLSGGEAQRVKLASFLGKGKSAGKILFIFDEPTTGLHFNDINKLLTSFRALINQGHSVIVIEHNTDVLKCADWIIDLGPEAGDNGGTLVYAGIPSGLKKVPESFTGQYL